jgi:hypothetical protein
MAMHAHLQQKMDNIAVMKLARAHHRHLHDSDADAGVVRFGRVAVVA